MVQVANSHWHGFDSEPSYPARAPWATGSERHSDSDLETRGYESKMDSSEKASGDESNANEAGNLNSGILLPLAGPVNLNVSVFVCSYLCVCVCFLLVCSPVPPSFTAIVGGASKPARH